MVHIFLWDTVHIAYLKLRIKTYLITKLEITEIFHNKISSTSNIIFQVQLKVKLYEELNSKLFNQ